MAKVILIVSILAMCGSIFFGLKNRSTLIEKRSARIEINNRIAETRTDIETKINEVNNLNTQIVTAKKSLAELEETIQSRDLEIASNKRAISTADAEIQGVQSQIAALNAQLKEAGVDNAGVLQQTIDDLERGIVIAQEEAETLAKEVDLAQSVVAKNRETAENYRDRAAKRNAGISANGLVGRVSDVNDELGFAVLSVGQNRGITAQSQFLVLRGDTYIAKLDASSVEPNLTIANIIPGSVRQGASVLPGDSVILANVQK